MGKRVDPSTIASHVLQALAASIAETEGNEAHARRLRAEVRFRLISMSDEELRQLARLVAHREQAVELAYKKFKAAIEEHRETAGEWMSDLPPQRNIEPGE